MYIRCFWSVGVTKLGGVSFVRMLCISGWESLPNNLGWLATTGLQSRDALKPLCLSCLQLSRRLGEATPVYVMLLFLAALPNQRLAPNIKARGSIDFDSSVTGFVKRVTYVIYSYIVVTIERLATHCKYHNKFG